MRSEFDPALIAAFDQDMAAIDKMLDVAVNTFKAFEAVGGETFAIGRVYSDLLGNEEITRDRFVELFVGALSRLCGGSNQ